MKTVYISGPMSGYEDLNFPAFFKAEESLRNMGYQTINPAAIEQPVKSWEACMKKDIRELMEADAVVTLPGWEDSKGAKIEVNLAVTLGMEVYKYEELTADKSA